MTIYELEVQNEKKKKESLLSFCFVLVFLVFVSIVCCEGARLPPMWPGFESRTRRHMWVEFVVGSLSCSNGFSPGSPVFLPPQKLTLKIPIRIGISGRVTTL